MFVKFEDSHMQESRKQSTSTQVQQDRAVIVQGQGQHHISSYMELSYYLTLK